MSHTEEELVAIREKVSASRRRLLSLSHRRATLRAALDEVESEYLSEWKHFNQLERKLFVVNRETVPRCVTPAHAKPVMTTTQAIALLDKLPPSELKALLAAVERGEI